MAKVLTATKLINSVKRRALIPSNQKTFTDDDFLEILDEEFDVGILPHMLQIHEEHYVTRVDLTLDPDKEKYKIPYRATGNKLREVSFIDTAGNTYELSRISLEEVSDFQTYYTISNRNVFYVEGDHIVLPNRLFQQQGILRMYIYIRPNSLVKEDKCGQITGIDFDTGVVTLSSFPTDFSTLPKMDVIGHQSPCKIITFDLSPTSVNQTAKTVTFAPADLAAFKDEIQVNDYVCKFQETPLPQVPVELHPLLAQMAAVHCLEALGDSEGIKNAEKKLKKMETNTLKVVDDRVEGAPEKINNRNGPMREALGRRRRRSIF